MLQQQPTSPSAAAALPRGTSLYLGFVLTGTVTVLLGPILPVLAAQWGLADSQAGALFTAQFLGQTVGVGLTSWLLTAYGFRSPILAGYLLIAAGMVMLAGAPWKLAWIAIAVYGMGLGITLPASNLLIASANPRRPAAALSLLNAAWSLGAVACAPLLALAHRYGGYRVFLLILGAASAVAAAAIAAGTQPGSVPNPSDSREALPIRGRALLSLLILGILFFLYVGMENSLGGWATVYAQRIQNSRSGLIFPPSIFWATLMAGRFLAPLWLRRSRELFVVLASLALAVAGVVVLLCATGITGVLTGIGLAGLGLAPVFPITVAVLSRLGRTGRLASGPVFILASLGGATLPWLVGLVASRSGSLKIGLGVPLVAGVLMTLGYLCSRYWQLTGDEVASRIALRQVPTRL